MRQNVDRGRVLSEESGSDVELARKKKMIWMLFPLALLIVLIAAINANGAWVVWLAIFGLISLLMYIDAKRFQPMRVYETGIEYSKFLTRAFYPWHRLILYKEDNDGLHMRRVHEIEAKMGLLDNRTEVVELVTFSIMMPDYIRVKEYIKQSVVAANVAQGTKYRWAPDR